MIKYNHKHKRGVITLKNTKQQKADKQNSSVIKDKNKNLRELYNKGKVNYILAHGVLSWGLSTGIIFIFLTSFFQYGFNFRVITENLFSKNNLITLGLFAAAGSVWGSIMWKIIVKEVEKKHSKHKR